MRVICISGKAQHGKDTTAMFMKEILEAQGKKVLVAHFADLLKYICKTFFGWDGQKDEKGRSILQYVGTDKIRKQKPGYWVDFIIDILEIFQDEWDYVLIPDCRFPNEYETFKNHGFSVRLVRVEGPNYDSGLTSEQQHHPSETALDSYPVDYKILNTACLPKLKAAARIVLENWDNTNLVITPKGDCVA